MGLLMKTYRQYLYEFTSALWLCAECYIFAFVFDIYSSGRNEFENKEDEKELVNVNFGYISGLECSTQALFRLCLSEIPQLWSLVPISVKAFNEP
jgi:hypothetical protein